MRQALKIHHHLGHLELKATAKVNTVRLKRLLSAALDQYCDEDRIPAEKLHDETKRRHGNAYRTPGYYLRLYRLRAGVTQEKLAEKISIRQHHLSEMEHNKRPIGKATAKKLAIVLKCDYHQFF